MLKLIQENRFAKDTDKAKKRGKDLQKLLEIVRLLVSKTPLPAKNRDHKLQGQYSNYRECHIEPDWLLIYQKTEDAIILARTGTHSDLF